MLNAAERLVSSFFDHTRPADSKRVYGPRVYTKQDLGKSYGMVWKLVARDTRHKDGAIVLRAWPMPKGKAYPPAKAGSREARRRLGRL